MNDEEIIKKHPYLGYLLEKDPDAIVPTLDMMKLARKDERERMLSDTKLDAILLLYEAVGDGKFEGNMEHLKRTMREILTGKEG